VNAAPDNCYHGGAFFEAIGTEFDHLERRHQIISADVLDAWFDPSPRVIAAISEELPWLLRTSPPPHCDGLVRIIARTRGVEEQCILCGAGSSDLIFLALGEWLTPTSHVLILDPMYGEYAHVLEQIIGCHVDRLELLRESQYRLTPNELYTRAQRGYDLVILVNPNSPTGQHVPRLEMEGVLQHIPSKTLVWVDETYQDYAGPNESLERFAADSQNIIVCKSMSKAYALSGARAAYLCGPQQLLARLRRKSPPWAVSLPAQVAAAAALQDPDYYAARWQETHGLRNSLAAQLAENTDWLVLPSVANFLLCLLPERGPAASQVVCACRLQGLFLRDARSMSRGRGWGDQALRMAVKDEVTNARMTDILQRVLPRSTKFALQSPVEMT